MTTTAPTPAAPAEDIPGVTRRHAFKDLYHERTNFQFIKHSKRWLIISTTLVVLSIALIAVRGLNFGIDFKGGTLMEVRAKSGSADLAQMRATLGGLGLGEVQLQQFGGPADVLLVAAEWEQNFGPSCPGCSALLEQSAVMQGALYGAYDLGFQNNSYIQGPMVSNQEIIQNSFTFNYIPPLIQVPFGTPGNSITTYDLQPPTNFTG